MPQPDDVPAKRQTFLGRLLSSSRGFLSRFFARKSPIGFQHETGSWTEPDIILSPAPSVGAPPRPLVNTNCKQSHVIYSVALIPVDDCGFVARQQALADAIAKGVDYFDNHFRCENEDCIKKVGNIIWTGTSCHKDPVTATGAVLVRFRCEVEL